MNTYYQNPPKKKRRMNNNHDQAHSQTRVAFPFPWNSNSRVNPTNQSDPQRHMPAFTVKFDPSLMAQFSTNVMEDSSTTQTCETMGINNMNNATHSSASSSSAMNNARNKKKCRIMSKTVPKKNRGNRTSPVHDVKCNPERETMAIHTTNNKRKPKTSNYHVNSKGTASEQKSMDDLRNEIDDIRQMQITMYQELQQCKEQIAKMQVFVLVHVCEATIRFLEPLPSNIDP
eukprot:1028093_1